MLGVGGLVAAAAIPAIGFGEEPNEDSSTDLAVQDKKLEKFSAPLGKKIESKDGHADSAALAGVVSVASHTFTFRRANGDAEEKTVAVNRPAGAGFIVTLSELRYAFMRGTTGNSLRERPLGEFIADSGLRGDNLVCRVRLTDVNADDPVSITITVGVLFFN